MKFRSVWLNLLQIHLYDNMPQETRAPGSFKQRLSKQPYILSQKIKAKWGEEIKFIWIIKAALGLEITVFSVSSLQWEALTSVNTSCQQNSKPLRHTLNVWLIVNRFDNHSILTVSSVTFYSPEGYHASSLSVEIFFSLLVTCYFLSWQYGVSPLYTREFSRLLLQPYVPVVNAVTSV